MRDVLLVDQRMVHRGDRVLPDQRFLRHERTQVACARSHVTVRQLEPGAGECVRQFLRVRHVASRNLLVRRVHAHGQVGRGHHRRVAPRRIMSIRHERRRGRIFRLPLMRTGGTLRQLPFVAEQGLEVTVVPLDGVGGPCAFQAAGDRVDALAAAKRILPAESLFLDVGALGLATDILTRIGCAMAFAEGVSAGHERHRLLVVHRHAGEGHANVVRRRDRIRVAVRTFRVHVDQAHLHGGEGIGELTVAAVTLVGQPLALRSPVDFLFGLPDIGPPAGKAEGLEPHRVQRDVAGEDHQVGPRDLAAILLLDRPQQPARLVQAHVVRPAVERREALRAGTGAAATIGNSVRACAVPGHADEERPVVTVVRGPPVLRIRHQGMQVLDHGIEVELLELSGVVETRCPSDWTAANAGAGSSGSAVRATSRTWRAGEPPCVYARRPRMGSLFPLTCAFLVSLAPNYGLESGLRAMVNPIGSDDGSDRCHGNSLRPAESAVHTGHRSIGCCVNGLQPIADADFRH